LQSSIRPSSVERRPRLAHVLDRDDDLEVELLSAPGIDDLALALGADEELRDRLQRPLCGRETDPLRVLATLRRHEMGQALERQRQVGAALRLRDGVDLVHDHDVGPGQRLAHLGGHDQVQRLGRRDQDIGRVALHRLTLLLGRVPRAQPDRDTTTGTCFCRGRTASA